MYREMRRCEKCWDVKPLSEFDRNYRIMSGYDIKCKACAEKDRRAYLDHIRRDA